MGIRELKARYGAKSNTAQAFHRAIRAEIPGGSAVLDALDKIGRARWRYGREFSGEIFELLCKARAEMANEIATCYELKSARRLEIAEQ